MKILFLTQYFPPEIGAPQNRLYELALRLQSNGIEINALTAMPNYPQMRIHDAYKGKFYFKEEMGGIRVFRSWIYVSSSKSVIPRLLNYFSFVFSSLFIGLFKLPKYDYILCESPPLFLGISSYLLSKSKKAGMIFNVSDLWPESAEKLDIISNKTMLNAATKLEEFCYRKSVLITGQTQGIVKNISGRFPKKQVYWLPNGVDLSFYNPTEYDKSWRERNGFSKGDLLFAYAGIHGHAQALEVIIKAAARTRDKKEIKFIMLGSGPVKDELVQLNKELSNDNVFFLDAITKDEMPHFVSAIDVSIVPLKNIPLFEGAIPSKIFENLAMEKAILLGVKGEAKELFIEEGECGLYFEPEDENSLAEKVLEIASHPEMIEKFGKNGRAYVDRKFNRNNIAKDFVRVLKELE